MVPSVGCPLGSRGEDVTTVPQVSSAIKRNGKLFTRPSVFISSHDGLETSSHQACSGFPAIGSLRDVDAVCSGSGGGVVEALSFPFSIVSDGPRGASARDASLDSSLVE